VSEIQRLCPEARVVYASATGASSATNMAYMSRLGLWGEGTSFVSRDAQGNLQTEEERKGFADFLVFKDQIQPGKKVASPAAMELVALNMKQSGMYMSRQAHTPPTWPGLSYPHSVLP
jgi:hypothetical protein